MRHLALVLFFCFLFAFSDGSDVIELTDENFDKLVSDGAWMVKVFAPWCSHCRKVRPVWEQLATELKDEGIHIGSVDGTKQPMLLRRFDSEGFPSFYHLVNGQCREYNGPRTVASFAEFARGGYTRIDAWPFYKAPNGSVMKLLAAAKRMPEDVVEVYYWLHNVQGYSPLTILALTLGVPVSFGLGLICILDYLHSRVRTLHTTPVARPHAD
eukprot:g7882.t1